ncbi:MAG TPA: hypothetical protein VGN80_19225 [Devosiaceae bacterium]|jgi:hypothetical protein|nr:hypothetical protein [Devosiaceae bacterium]
MGKGTDAARAAGAAAHAAVLDDFKDQLLITLLKRLKARGDDLIIPAAEVDDTGSDLVSFRIAGGAFHFTIARKH